MRSRNFSSASVGDANTGDSVGEEGKHTRGVRSETLLAASHRSGVARSCQYSAAGLARSKASFAPTRRMLRLTIWQLPLWVSSTTSFPLGFSHSFENSSSALLVQTETNRAAISLNQLIPPKSGPLTRRTGSVIMGRDAWMVGLRPLLFVCARSKSPRPISF